MYLIRQLAAKYGITRTTLLHYDAIGILSPSVRTKAGYRMYSAEDEKRLQNILLFRSMGISLESIGQLLAYDESGLANALMKRLDELNREIVELRQRQRNIINLLRDAKIVERLLSHGNLDKLGEVVLSGIKPLDWHEQFEAISPALHKEFLSMLDAIPESVKDSFRTSLDALPDEERNRLLRIIRRQL
jgi:MerR family transcriptional regulator, thiopeptide resistance regulator